MIDEKQFQLLKKELEKIKNLPLGWGGRRQNNADDDKIDLKAIGKMFDCKFNPYDLNYRTKYHFCWIIIDLYDYLFALPSYSPLNKELYQYNLYNLFRLIGIFDFKAKGLDLNQKFNEFRRLAKKFNP